MAKRSPTQSPEAMATAVAFGRALRAARLRRRLTQQAMAQRTGSSVQTVQRLEAGDAAVGLGHVLEYLVVLDPHLLHELLQPLQLDTLGHALRDAELPKRGHLPDV